MKTFTAANSLFIFTHSLTSKCQIGCFCFRPDMTDDGTWNMGMLWNGAIVWAAKQ